MALQKMPLQVTFGKGIDQASDPNQVTADNFLALQNAVFTSIGRLQKRAGFPKLTDLPDANSTNLATLNGNLLATGTQLRSYSADTNKWIDQGKLQPVDVAVKAVVRTTSSQYGVDSVTAPSGLTCLVYSENSKNYYQVIDSTTGQQLIAAVQLPATAIDARTFLLGSYFIITFLDTTGGSPHLQFISISVANPALVSSPTDISTTVEAIAGAGYDAVVANNTLYIAYSGSDVGGAIRMNLITATLSVSSPLITNSYTADRMSVTADTSGVAPIIYATWWDAVSSNAYTMPVNAQLIRLHAPTQVVTGEVLNQITSVATAGLCTIFYQVTNTVAALGSVRSDYVKRQTITQAAVVGTATVIKRSVGLASKAYFGTANTIYLTLIYAGAEQPTYFISDSNGNLVAKIAYSNGGGYSGTQVLPSVSSNGDIFTFAYLIKDLLVPVNKTQGAATSTGVYTQTGVNLAQIGINTTKQYGSEVAGSLQLTGGFVWQYDGVKPIELGFHVYPEGLKANTATTGGFITAQQYFYKFCYEWTDAAGQLHRSAPSVPVGQLVPAGTATNTVTINVPTLRLTYKVGLNPVRLVGYRWSTAQQSYYQFTSITSPVVNDATVDSIAVVDTLADASILGNTLLYTTGGVLENIAAPACTTSTLFKNRIFVIDAEDRNLLWYSKQVLSNTPVEFTDLQTIYVAPTIGAQSSTGPCTAIAGMDDKLIIFKENALYYVTGSGPDVTGANDDFREATYITSAVGCMSPSSIVLTPAGLMFESNKGIWLLNRSLSTEYIGTNVQGQSSTAHVLAAVAVPGVNEVRFTMDDNTTLMYDYYQKQWCSFVGIPSISSVIYNGAHTILNTRGRVLQQQVGTYLDDDSPVLISFTTAWLKVTGLQGLQRIYSFFILSNYLTPHKLSVGIAYDYDNSLLQTLTIVPSNVNLVYGGDTLYGGSSPYGGSSAAEQFRIFPDRQKCESLSVTVTEIYNAGQGIAPGAGLTISGLNFSMGGKKATPTLTAAQSKA